MGSEAPTPTDQQARLSQTLTDLGWTQKPYDYALGRRTGAIDAEKDGRRFLFYPTTPADSLSYRLLADNKLPVFPVVDSPVVVPEGITTVELPPGARALDGMEFPDQEPKPGYFGSFEMMDAIAQLLARIYKETGTLPDSLRLNKLAIEQGEENTIRLVPPLNLVPQINLAKLIKDLREDLDTQNPQYNHEGQVNHLRERFASFLEK